MTLGRLAVDNPLAHHMPPTLGAVYRLQWHDNSGDGYQWCAAVDELPATGPERWAVVAAWGREGWDLGSWPLVAYARGVVNRPGGVAPWRVVERVEGDCQLWAYATRAAMYDALDTLARAFWSENPAYHGPDVAAAIADTPPGEPLPIRFRGPFTWERLRRYQDEGTDPYLETYGARVKP